MVRYYKKSVPATPVTLSDGRKCTFTTLDHMYGYFATQSDAVQNEFSQMIEQMRYGLSEVSAEEFTRDYLDKKKAQPTTSNKPWREELRPNGVMMDTSSKGQPPSRVADVVDSPLAINVSDIPRAAVTELTPEVSKSLPDANPQAPEFEPPVGHRKVRQ